ncbi:MAG: hypothetical protein K6U75_05960 [Firmicutes bacterium]|nr:hypothetical protein [Bacillota bacterium]
MRSKALALVLIAVTLLAVVIAALSYRATRPAITPQEAYEIHREQLQGIAEASSRYEGAGKGKYQPPKGFVAPQLDR